MPPRRSSRKRKQSAASAQAAPAQAPPADLSAIFSWPPAGGLPQPLAPSPVANPFAASPVFPQGAIERHVFRAPTAREEIRAALAALAIARSAVADAEKRLECAMTRL